MGNDVEGDALGELLALERIGDEDGAGLVEQLVHAVLAGTGDRLVGRHHDALDGGAVMQRLQRDDELGGRAVRIGDDVLLGIAHDGIRIDFRNDQRNFRIVAPGRGIVDHDAALCADLGENFWLTEPPADIRQMSVP